MGVHWKDWCWSWNSNNWGTWCEELTHLKSPWCWEGLGAGGDGEDRGWDGWMESLTQWTWVWVNSRSWWWTGMPGVLQFMGSQRVGQDWATELSIISYVWNHLILWFLLFACLYPLSAFPISHLNLRLIWNWFLFMVRARVEGSFFPPYMNIWLN